VVIASGDQTAQVWDETTGERLEPLLRHQGVVYAAQFSRDGKWIVTASADHTARVWDTTTLQECFRRLTHSDAVYDAAFSPDDRCIVTAAADHFARVWDFRLGRLAAPPLASPAEVTLATFSPDGERILTVAKDNAVRLWLARSGEMLGAPMVHNGLINSATFSPNGQWIATASRDKTARIWDAHTGQPISETLAHEGNVNAVDFSPDSQRVLTASDDGTARVWDINGMPRSPPFPHKLGATCSRFDPSGHWLVVGSGDLRLYSWEFVLAPLTVPDWLPELVEAVVGQRFTSDRRFAFVPGDELFRLKGQLAERLSSDSIAAWVKWFLAQPLSRQVSPSATKATELTLQERIYQADQPSLDQAPLLEEALEIWPDNGLIHAQLARLAAQDGSTNRSARLAVVDKFSRRALEFLPHEATTWWARAVYFDLLDDEKAALEAFDQASQFGSDNVYFWLGKARFLEAVDRIDAAYVAFSEVVRTGERTGRPALDRAWLFRERAAFLERHGRLAEAKEDRLHSSDVEPRSAPTPARSRQIPPIEYEALVDLYHSAGGPHWHRQTGWLDPEAASWEGVDMSEGTVHALSLGANNLNGVIPESIKNLPNLGSLLLSDNRLRGAIPDGLGHLVQLRGLYLAGNRLSGRIPSSLGNLVNLQWLILNSNELSGEIPGSLGNLVHLQYLLLWDNHLSGSIPASFGKLVSLRQCSLGEAMFSGHNQLTGNMPESLLNLVNLQNLDLSHNCFDICPGSQPWTVIDQLLAAGKAVRFMPQDGCAPVFRKLTAIPNVLWPPNHQMIAIKIEAVASDTCGSTNCKIVHVSTEDLLGGDGHQAPDCEITGNLTLNLRAERTETGPGRTYNIYVECRDASGNSREEILTVTVPHDQPGK
jgi:tetratricopeptide (TPR) repeat protein